MFHWAGPDHLSPIDRSDCDTIYWITPDLAEVRGKQRVSPSPIPRWLSPSPRAQWPSVAIMGPDGALADTGDSEHGSQQSSKKLPFSFAPCARPPASAPRSILSLSASAASSARRQQGGLATRPSTTRTRPEYTRSRCHVYLMSALIVFTLVTSLSGCLLSVVCCLVSVETPMSTHHYTMNTGHTGGQATAAVIHFTSDIKKLRLQISTNAFHLMATLNIVGFNSTLCIFDGLAAVAVAGPS